MDDFTDRSQFRIGDLLVIPGRLIVVRDGQEIKLEPRWMEVLVMLAEHAGETLSTERLLIEVWGSTVYGDSPVSKTISYIRKSISDDSRKPRYVETVSKVGYRLIAPVSLPEDYRRMPSERWTNGSPYVGLSAFGADHASVFCGRSRIVADLLRAMRVQIENQRRFVLIVGASGCGKTSLLRAGAIPLLTKPDGFDGLRAVSVTTCDLAANGSDPLIPLTAALAAWTLGTRPVFPPQTPEQLKALLTETPDIIEGFVSEAFRRHSERDMAEQPYTHLLLTVDHAEALVATTDIDTDARDAFARVLEALCACPHVMVTMIARGDFYLKLIEALPALAELKAGDGHLDVMAPRYGEIGEIIRSPAWKADLSFETDPETRTRLDDALRDAALSQPDALPLLQHTLQILYERRNSQQQLTFAAYNDIGGLEGAIAHRAEEVFAALPASAQAGLDAVLAELIVIQPDNAAVNARRTSITAFDAGARTLVDVFTISRLFVRDHHNGQSTVGVVHEALLRRWPRAVEWTQDNRRLLQAKARLQRAATRWVEEGRRDDHLLNPGRPLSESLEIMTQMPGDIGPDMHALIAASGRSDRRRRRLRKLAVVLLAAFGIASTSLAVVAYHTRNEAEARRIEAERANTFMLKEIARDLEHIGDLKLLESISKRAIDTYKTKPLDALSLEDRINYSRALRIRGRVRMGEGKLRSSQDNFLRAEEVVTHAVGDYKSSIDAQYEFSQTSYWLGYIQMEQKNFHSARRHFIDYRIRAERLRSMDRNNPEWIMEESFPHNNLATLALQLGATSNAVIHLERSLSLKRQAVNLQNRDEWRKEMADTQSWIGMALESLGRLDESSAHFTDAINELTPISAINIDNKEWIVQLSSFRQLEARLNLSRGLPKQARDSIILALEALDPLASGQKANNLWIYRLASAHQIAGDCQRAIGDRHASKEHYVKSLSILEKIKGDGTEPKHRRLKAVTQLGLIRLERNENQPNELTSIVEDLEKLSADAPQDEHIATALADALLLSGEQWQLRGNTRSAQEAWRRVMHISEARSSGKMSPQLIAARVIAKIHMDGYAAASKDIDHLARIGYRNPDYLELLDLAKQDNVRTAMR